jgi:hypothetical protein
MARSDDTGSLKIAIIEWVGTEFGVSNPPLRPRYKEHRGLESDFCGNLLCPAEFDWADLRSALRCHTYLNLNCLPVFVPTFEMVTLTSL